MPGSIVPLVGVVDDSHDALSVRHQPGSYTRLIVLHYGTCPTVQVTRPCVIHRSQHDVEHGGFTRSEHLGLCRLPHTGQTAIGCMALTLRATSIDFTRTMTAPGP